MPIRNIYKKRPPISEWSFAIFLQKERLEYEYELSTCFFARISIALFSTGSEGLHYRN